MIHYISKKIIKKTGKNMLKFACINISSKNPKALAEFYRKIGAAVFVDGENYDGFNFGNDENQSGICVWDENIWGKSTAGYITIVFKTNNLQQTRNSIIANGIELPPIQTADWGGQQLVFNDPDGNIITVLT
ncbi:MAG: VOC family protein [Oscillospiraceae bacterium]|jgi:predicted enzyme related to lactoylglutathione lyase|nr:VOC family protein [Oscillospiraceae bacterium]